MSYTVEMPKYKCHKEVHALKIADVHANYDGLLVITPADTGHEPFVVMDPGWKDRYKGDGVDLGYYVVYEDGYTSWSPTKAFEEGYTRINGPSLTTG